MRASYGKMKKHILILYNAANLLEMKDIYKSNSNY